MTAKTRDMRAESDDAAISGIVDEILVAEGWPTFSDDRDDKGGPTKGGITLATLARWREKQGRPTPSVADLRALDESEARAIYTHEYITGPRFDEIADPLLRHNVIDAGVLHGQGWAARRLQEIVGVKVDGDVGDITLGAVNAQVGAAVNIAFTRRRVEKVVRIALRDHSQLKWLRGWINRALGFLEIEAVLHDG